MSMYRWGIHYRTFTQMQTFTCTDAKMYTNTCIHTFVRVHIVQMYIYTCIIDVHAHVYNM